MSFRSIGVIGAGSWGTALALVLQDNALPVTIWGNNAPHIMEMRKSGENAAYLPGVKLPSALRLTTE